MEAQNANTILDNTSNEWAIQSAQDKKQIAILREENQRLKNEIERLQSSAE